MKKKTSTLFKKAILSLHTSGVSLDRPESLPFSGPLWCGTFTLYTLELFEVTQNKFQHWPMIEKQKG